MSRVIVRTSKWLTHRQTDRQTDTHTDAGNDNTRRPKLASGKKLKQDPWAPATDLDLLSLSKKLVFMILIVTGQRGQVIIAMVLKDMSIGQNYIKFRISNLALKQGRPGYKPEPLTIRSYELDENLCPVVLLKEYLQRTEKIRGEVSKLFLSTTKPHRAASRDTISRWTKSVLRDTGVDVSEFAAGSTRASATSAPLGKGVTLDEIMTSAGWSRATTFSKWYKKKVTRNVRYLSDALLE